MTGRNDICWCGSGKKYKRCHLDRERQEAPSPYDLAKRAQRRRGRGICFHPFASLDGCSGKTIDSHTVQKRGSLAAITDSTGHLLSGKFQFRDLERSNGEPVLVKIGNNRASTFPGFCAKHDTELFKPIEGAELSLDGIAAFLFAFRAVALELFNKRNALQDLDELALMDAGKPLAQQKAIQGYLAAARMGQKKGASEIEQTKGLYDDVFARSAWDEVHYAAVWFDEVLPLAFATGLLPEFDYAGSRLQSLLDFSKATEHVTISLASYNKRSVLVFAWLGRADGAARAFVDSYLSLPADQQADAIASTALEITENVYVSLDWWGTLDQQLQKKLTRQLASGTPMAERTGKPMQSRFNLSRAKATAVVTSF